MTLQRADRTDQVAQKPSCNVELYWAVDPYDLVAITEAPDDSARAFATEVDSAGSARTTALRACDRQEMPRILERLG